MKRDIIPVCSVHNRFQTENHRWLNKSEDFDTHVLYTHSQDASILESPCDMCEGDPNQLEIEFEEEKYYDMYTKLHNSGMFWEFHPELVGEWEFDKQKFIKYQKDLDNLIQIIL